MGEEAKTEKMIQDKGLNAPRLTPADIDAVITGVTYTRLPSRKCLICEITLKNGFTVRGEAACVSPENFDQEIGEKVSFQNARDKIWQLEGYLLQEKHPAAVEPGLSFTAALEALRIGYRIDRPGWNRPVGLTEGDRAARDWRIVEEGA